jgi:hypothetical protein
LTESHWFKASLIQGPFRRERNLFSAYASFRLIAFHAEAPGDSSYLEKKPFENFYAHTKFSCHQLSSVRSIKSASWSRGSRARFRFRDSAFLGVNRNRIASRSRRLKPRNEDFCQELSGNLRETLCLHPQLGNLEQVLTTRDV